MTAAERADRVVVLDVVGLESAHLTPELAPNLADLVGDRRTDLRPPFPAITIPAQTTLATGQAPATHGDVANGVYDRDRDAVEFWGRERGTRNRLWEAASDAAGLRTGVLCFQHLEGTTADVALTPSPIEDEDNTLLEMDCWTNPDDWYDDLRADRGHFPLHRYWGPGAGAEGSEWILGAAAKAVERFDVDLLWVYVPHLDYDGLRHGPSSREFREALSVVDELVGTFLDALRADDRWAETAVVVTSEYGFHDVSTPVFPNRALREAGLLVTSEAGDGDADVDLGSSTAFAMVDHQVAHVYADEAAVDEARTALTDLDGVDAVLVGDERDAYGLDHPNAGELVCVAEPSAWFQYYWWDDPANAPPYARSVDIHAKPGFDPCELFFGDSGLVSLDPSQVRGSHGRTDAAGCLAIGGPVGDTRLPDAADARAVAPTVAALLGVHDAVEMAFERASLFDA